MQSSEPNTYTWLLTAADACPACGRGGVSSADICPACGRELVLVVKPPQRSVNAFTLAMAWSFAVGVALLAIVACAMQLLGTMEPVNDPALLRAVLAAATAGGLFALVLAWGCWTRRPFSLYVGIALAALAGLAGAVAGLRLLDDLPALSAALLSLLLAGGLILMHVSTIGEFRGQRRRLDTGVSAQNARQLYAQGREHYAVGLTFLAAQCWVRAVGRDPANVGYHHALGLALAKLGHPDRAAVELERALALAPENSQLRQDYDFVRRQAVEKK